MEFIKIFIANEGARFFTNKTIAAKKFCAHQARKREVGIPPPVEEKVKKLTLKMYLNGQNF